MDFLKVYEQTKNLNILFAEDDLNFREETLDIFKQLFKNIVTSSNGQEALEQYKAYFQENNKYYDIVISDIKMPKMDGVELTQNIYHIHKEQPIIILSAHNESDYLMKLVNIGIEQFLMKPLEVDNLLNVLYNTSKKINLKKEKASIANATIIPINNDYTWNKKTLELQKENQSIKLSNYERKLLELLIKNKHRAIPHEEILSTIWQDKQFDVNENVVKGTIYRIRNKAPELLIENISKLGYRLIL